MLRLFWNELERIGWQVAALSLGMPLATWFFLYTISFSDLISVLADGALIAASIAAILGVKQWRKQIIGQRQFEVALETLTVFRRVVNLLKEARHPFGYVGEGQSRPGRDEETDEGITRLRDSYFVTIERIDAETHRLEKLDGIYDTAIILLGEDRVERPMRDIRDILNEIRLATKWLIMTTKRDREPQTEKALEAHRIREAAIWDHGTRERPDEITARLDEAMKELRDNLGPLVRLD